MEYEHQRIVVKQMASLLAENEATVSDLPLIFEKVRENLKVVCKDAGPRQSYIFGQIMVPPERTEDGKAYTPSPCELTDDGNRRGDEQLRQTVFSHPMSL